MENSNPQFQSDLNFLVRSLRSILVLSILGSGLSAFSYLGMGLNMQALSVMYQSAQAPEYMKGMMEMLLNVPRMFFVLQGLLYLISFIGAIFMWKLRRVGFHCYTLSQLCMLVVPVLFLGRSFLNIGDLMLTLLFVGFYFVMFRKIAAIEMLETEQSSLEDDSNPDIPEEN